MTWVAPRFLSLIPCASATLVEQDIYDFIDVSEPEGLEIGSYHIVQLPPPHAPRAVLIFLSLQATFSRSSFTEDAGPIGEADLGERILFFIAKN